MQVEAAAILTAEPEAAATLETLEEIYQRVFRQLRPRTPLPAIRIEFRRYANANAQIRLESGTLRLRLADTLESAPASVMEALAEILLAKLFRRPVPAESNDRYRRYLNRRDIRRSLDLVRQIRGRKRVEGPHGMRYDLNQIFEELNFRYFNGLMARPILGWSPYASRTCWATTIRPTTPSSSAVFSTAATRPNWPSNTCSFTRCCIYAIPPSTRARAAACTRATSKMRNGNLKASRKRKSCSRIFKQPSAEPCAALNPRASPR